MRGPAAGLAWVAGRGWAAGLGWVAWLALAGAAAAGDAAMSGLVRADFADLPGFADDDHGAALETFLVSCGAMGAGQPSVRAAQPASEALQAVCAAALAQPARDRGAARRFFETAFVPWRIVVSDAPHAGLLTGYYEPEVDGALEAEAAFAEPLLARPDDLITLPLGETAPTLPAGVTSARRTADGRLEPYPDRRAIDEGALGNRRRPLVWLADAAETFLIHVQGSARVRLADGQVRRLAYAGRNGQPYTSIGRILMDSGALPEPAMSLAALKSWLRQAGLAPGEPGRDLLWRNRSFIFFKIDDTLGDAVGPTGAAGVPLSPLRSIAVDRSLWSYGLPFYIAASLPWQSSTRTPFQRLMIAQDTGSAIVGAARADLFFGSGPAAGARAGDIRQTGTFFVLLPRGLEPGR